MRQSESIAKLATALVKFQGEVESAKKDSVNPHFKSKYADITAVLDACRGPLVANGIAVVQMPSIDGDRPVLTTRVMHVSGEWLEGEWPLNPVKNDPQGLGAASTYARRYSLMAALGIATEDDDGEAASGRGDSGGQSRPAQSRTPGSSPKPDAAKDAARDAYARIQSAMKAAKSKAEIDDLFAREAKGLITVKDANEDAYGKLIALAQKIEDGFLREAA